MIITRYFLFVTKFVRTSGVGFWFCGPKPFCWKIRLLSWKFGYIHHCPQWYAKQGPSDSLFCYDFSLLRLTGFLQAMGKDLPLWTGHQQWSWQASMSDRLSISTPSKYQMSYYSDWLKDLLNIGIHNLFRTFNLNAGAIWVVRWITNTFLAAGFLVTVRGFCSGIFVGCFFFRGGTIVRVAVLVLSGSHLRQKFSD